MLRFGSLSENEELSYLVLENRGQVHYLHSRVCNVDLLLELSLLSSTHLRQHSHVSEKSGVEDCHTNQYAGAQNDLSVGPWAHFISSQEQHRVIKGAYILVEVRLAVKPVNLGVLPGVHEIEGRDPVFVLLDYEVPETAHQMHAQYQLEYQKAHPEHLCLKN